jgi:sugar-specific transcriptional regulator TrmB
MTTTALQHIIQSVGLEPHEAKLYLAGLKLGSAPASSYAKDTKLNRVTAYNYLEELVKRSMFTAAERGRTMHYAPVPPDQLSIEARKNVEALERAMPDLRSLMGSHHRAPHVRYFEGVEGVRKVYQDTLTADGELLNFANSAVVRDFWKEYDKEYVNKRIKKGIFLKGIAPDDAMGRKVHGKDNKSLREIRLVNAKEFPIHNEINIYDNKVAIVSFAEDEADLFGVIIESKEVAETQKQVFEMAWRFALLGESSRKGGVKSTKKEAIEEGVRKDQLNMF